jgi:hypothetical protein
MAIPDTRGMLCWHRGELGDAAELFAHARQIARHESDRTSEFQALEHQLCVLLELGWLEAARSVSGELSTLGDRLRGGSEAPIARALCALLDYAGERESAAGSLSEAMSELRQADAKQRLTHVLLVASETDLEQGRTAVARERAGEALALATALARQSDAARARVVLAKAAELAGHEADLLAQKKALLAVPQNILSARARQRAREILGHAGRAGTQQKDRRNNGARRRGTSPE